MEKPVVPAIWFKNVIPFVQPNHQPTNIDEGIVICGWRHGAVINLCFTLFDKTYHQMGESIEGFVTNNNRFVDREEAFILFKQNNPNAQTLGTTELYSEDLY